MASFTTRSVFHPPRIRLRPTPWLAPLRRHFVFDAPSDPDFQQVRDEMLDRTLPVLSDFISRQHTQKLESTLSSFVPLYEADFRSLGQHLIYCNAAEPSDELLPDGLDALHSPGNPYVRRMWAGGLMRLDVPKHYGMGMCAWRFNREIVGVERIKNVQMRGQAGDEKIFVNVERRFARATGKSNYARGDGSTISMETGLAAMPELLRRQAHEEQEWGDATIVEERSLVFLRGRNEAELEPFRAGQMAPLRYLDSPGQPEFSHTLTPTRALLFRYSALTFNAHAIHLDPEYARNVEGYRNLLVHGPLLVTLMLKLVEAHLQSLPGPQHVMQSVEYRNFAPLHCDEEMRLCGREKTVSSTEVGRVYDVWIEGPTGGMAVKGTVHTAPLPPQLSTNNRRNKYIYGHLAPEDSEESADSSPSIPTRREKRKLRAEQRGILRGISFPTAEKAVRRILASRKDPTANSSESIIPIRRIVAPPGPLIPVASLTTRSIAYRLGLAKAEQELKDIRLEVLPLVRKYNFYEADDEQAESKFKVRGVTKVEVRPVSRLVAT